LIVVPAITPSDDLAFLERRVRDPRLDPGARRPTTLALMTRLAVGCALALVGLGTLMALGAREWQFPLFMVAAAPVVLVSGLVMGLHEEPPPWRRRHRAQ
jgi:hypothetical protein